MKLTSILQPRLKLLFVIFWVLLLVVSFFALARQGDGNWSKPMDIRMSVGFRGQLSSPLIAAQLSSSPAEFAEIFDRKLGPGRPQLPASDPIMVATRKDADALCALLKVDRFFIICYLPLVLLYALVLRHRNGLPSDWLAWTVFIGIVLTVIADLIENRNSFRAFLAIKEDAALDASVIAWMRSASLVKWGLLAGVILILAWGTARLKTLVAAIASLVLLGGGIALIWGIVTHKEFASLIQVGFSAVCLGFVLTLFVVLGKARPSDDKPPATPADDPRPGRSGDLARS